MQEVLGKHLGRVPERFFIDAGKALDVLVAFKGNLCIDFVFTFTLALEWVFRGVTRDGPGSATATTVNVVARARLAV